MNTELSAHIAVCDDEEDLREMVGMYLTKRNFKVSLAGSGAQLDQLLCDSEDISLVLLDINMPGEDGLSVLRRLRTEREMPVIMLTAAGEPVDRIVGLEMGADDYLGKPVDLRELEARIKAVLRRTEKPDPSVDVADIDNAESVKIRDMQLDMANGQLNDAQGNNIPLTAMEFTLLKLFIRNTGRVLNRDQLMEMASDREWDPFDRSIDIRIMRLRKKIETNPAKPEIIRTVRGLGYIFDPANRYAG